MARSDPPGPADATRLAEWLAGWPSPSCAGWVSVAAAHEGTAATGPVDVAFPWASVTKIVTSLAVWVAVEEGTVSWTDPAGPRGSTLAHLLSHASGLAPDGDRQLAPPGTRRIYSNGGIELAAEHVAARAAMAFEEYLDAAVFRPLGLSATLDGSPASGASGPLTDLLAVGRELLVPTLIDRSTLGAVTAVAFPGLDGVLPGFGQQRPNDWGLGVEIRDSKRPHWTGAANSPATFGHFGQSGSFLWVDPEAGLALASLSRQPFGSWAASAWPRLSDALIDALHARRG